MEAMWDRMNLLGLDEYSTKFLCAGIESVEAMEAVTEADLIEDMGCTEEECRQVLTAIYKSKNAQPIASAPLAEPSATRLVEDTKETPSGGAAEATPQQLPQPPAEPRPPKEEPPPPPPAVVVPPAATVLSSREELDPDGQGMENRVAELMNINDLLSKKVIQLTEKVENSSFQAEILALQDELEASQQFAEKANEAAQFTAEAKVGEIQKQVDAEMAAVRKEADAQVSALRAEIAELKGLHTAEREMNESRVLTLETSLEREREAGRGALRGDLDGFMSEVVRLGGQLEEEKEARKAAESLLLEREGGLNEANRELQTARSERTELRSKLAASDANMAEYQKSVEEELVSRRKAAREGEGGTREGVASGVRLVELEGEAKVLRETNAGLLAQLQQAEAGERGRHVKEAHASIRLEQQRVAGLEELRDSLINAAQNVSQRHTHREEKEHPAGAEEGETPAPPEGASPRDEVAVLVLAIEAEIEKSFGAAIDRASSRQKPGIEGALGGENTAQQAGGEGANPAEATPVQGQRGGLADKLYGAMSMFMPYDDD